MSEIYTRVEEEARLFGRKFSPPSH